MIEYPIGGFELACALVAIESLLDASSALRILRPRILAHKQVDRQWRAVCRLANLQELSVAGELLDPLQAN